MTKTMLYRHPGPHIIDGEGYAYITVDDGQIDDCLNAGWFESIAAALGNSGTVVDDVAPVPERNVSQPSDNDPSDADLMREELSGLHKDLAEESKANRAFLELVANSAEVPFQKNISDAKLRARLTEAIEAGMKAEEVETNPDGVDEKTAD